MKYDKLLELEKEALGNKHYQHKDMSDADRLVLALNSFDRLTPDDKTLVVKSWNTYCDKHGLLPDPTERTKKLVWFRFLAQSNLYFLCKLLEKYKDITENTHEEICNDFFVSKEPGHYKTFEEFAKSYRYLKDRMLLVPRGGFKSSIDIADCVQWIICFPEVTILILTGVYGLAKDFVGELSGHFTLQETGETIKDKPVYGPKKMMDGTESLFQILFPDHCVKPGSKETEFQTPACKTPDKEPTVMSAGIEQSLSGWHFGILKLDDVVTNENSCTPTRLESVNKQISVNRAMLHPFGFFDVIGTWYDEADYYGITIAYEERYAKEEGLEGLLQGSPFEGKFNSSANTIIYLRAAWWPTSAAKALGKIESEMVEDDWEYWFPERLPYKFLLKEKKKDPDGFAIKYENNPRKVHQVKFPRELLIRKTIPATMLPINGMVVTTVDTAYSIKNYADYTVIITAIIYGGKFYVIDMVRGRFNEFELPATIAATGNKWKPKRIAIEDSVGVRWMNREIRREMDKLGISIPVDYVSLGKGTKNKDKENKAKPVIRLLGDDRLYFSMACSGLEELYNELEKFPKGSHDDIVSALSILVDQFAAFADMEAKVNYVQNSYVQDQKAKERHDMIYGIGKYSHLNAATALDDNPVTQYQIGNMPNQPDATDDINPLTELF